MSEPTKAVVLHSGGQDSTTCLIQAIRRYGTENVYPLLINYDQRHQVELACARRVCDILDVPERQQGYLEVMALAMLEGAALTSMDIEVSTDATDTGNDYAERHNLPSTFVPGRNVIFLGLAAAFGAKVGAYTIVTGVCEADDAGYPDCRESFVQSMEMALREALAEDEITIWAPLLHKSKAETWALADEAGYLDLIIDETHTCYMGERIEKHAWGFGCGACGACIERERGYEAFKSAVAG